MLVKLTPVFHFINILSTNFLYERRFGSFFYVHVTREKDVRKKICAKNIGEIDTWMTG